MSYPYPPTDDDFESEGEFEFYSDFDDETYALLDEYMGEPYGEPSGNLRGSVRDCAAAAPRAVDLDEASSPGLDAEEGPETFEAGQKTRAIRFTWNNPTDLAETLLARISSLPSFRYMIFQKEIGANGTPHFQGYIMFRGTQRYSVLHSRFPSGFWILRADASPSANIRYCSKEEGRIEGPWEAGDKPDTKESRRGRLAAVAGSVQSGKSLKRIREEDPALWIVHGRGIKEFALGVKGDALRDMRVRLSIGPTGSGKTHDAVFSREDDEEVFIKKSGQWFDGYLGEPAILWDEFTGAKSKCTVEDFLRMTDRFRCPVEFKGGTIFLKNTEWIFTTNIHPRKWWTWTDREEQYAALVRRFTSVVKYAGRDSKVVILPCTQEWDDFWWRSVAEEVVVHEETY